METDAAQLSPGRAYHLLCSMVAPRPIAWVTSLSEDGVVNAAPFSWFQAICADPPLVVIAVVDKDEGGLKDTARNVQAQGDFVINIAHGDQLEDVVATSAELPPDVSEVDAVGLATAPAAVVTPPRIAGCAGYLECRLVETHRYGRDKKTTLLVAEVIHFAVRDDLVTERGMLDASRAQLPARLGGNEYLTVETVRVVKRP